MYLYSQVRQDCCSPGFFLGGGPFSQVKFFWGGFRSPDQQQTNNTPVNIDLVCCFAFVFVWFYFYEGEGILAHDCTSNSALSQRDA